ncbi:hypothetical protein HEM39_024255, partial [Escherichia coli]|nr:hypothetical protein [Escherichia coli]
LKAFRNPQPSWGFSVHNKTLAKSANGYKPSQLNTKDNIQKTINTNTPLPPNGGGDGQVKPERRKAERIDYE